MVELLTESGAGFKMGQNTFNIKWHKLPVVLKFLVDSLKIHWGLSINHMTWSNAPGVRQKVTLGHVDM